jgi:arsenate reductase (glutaredoxin)
MTPTFCRESSAGLLGPEIDDDTLLAAMTEHPELVNRPIVCTPKGVRLCRPAERMLNLLEQAPAAP